MYVFIIDYSLYYLFILFFFLFLISYSLFISPYSLFRIPIFLIALIKRSSHRPGSPLDDP